MSKPLYQSHANYLARVFNQPEQLCQEVCHLLEGVDFDSFVVQGASGCLIVDRISRAMGKPYAYVRKEGDGSHSGWMVEGVVGQKWIFLDDFVSSGTTFARVVGHIINAVGHKSECVGILEHSTQGERARWIPRARFLEPDFFRDCWGVKDLRIPDGTDQTPAPLPGTVNFVGPMPAPLSLKYPTGGLTFPDLLCGVTIDYAKAYAGMMRKPIQIEPRIPGWWTNKASVTGRTRLDELAEMVAPSPSKRQQTATEQLLEQEAGMRQQRGPRFSERNGYGPKYFRKYDPQTLKDTP